MPTTSARLAYIRNRAKTFFLTSKCTLQRKTISSSGPWQQSPAYTTIAEDVPCRVTMQQQLSENDADTLSGQEVLPEYYVLTIPYDQIIDVDYRVIYESQAYEITAIEAELTDRAFRQVIITRKRGQG